MASTNRAFDEEDGATGAEPSTAKQLTAQQQAAAAKAAERDPSIAKLIKQLGGDSAATRAIAQHLYDQYGLSDMADLGRSDPYTYNDPGEYVQTSTGDSGEAGYYAREPGERQVTDYINKKTGQKIGNAPETLGLGSQYIQDQGTISYYLDKDGKIQQAFTPGKKSHGLWDQGLGQLMSVLNVIPGANLFTIPITAGRAALNGDLGKAAVALAPLGLDYLTSSTDLLSNLAGPDFNPMASTPSGMIAEATGLGLQGLPADMLGNAALGAAKAGLTGGDVGTGALVGGAAPLIGQGVKSLTGGIKDLATSASDVLKGDAGNDILAGGAGADQLTGASISPTIPEGEAEQAEWYRQIATLPENDQRAMLGGLTAEEALLYRTYAGAATGAGDLRPSDLGMGSTPYDPYTIDTTAADMGSAFLTDEENQNLQNSKFDNTDAKVSTSSVVPANILSSGETSLGYDWAVDPNNPSMATTELLTDDLAADTDATRPLTAATSNTSTTDNYGNEGRAYSGNNAIDPTTSSPINAAGGTSDLVDTTSNTKTTGDTKTTGGGESNVVNNIITGAVTGAITKALTDDDKKTTTTTTGTVSAVDSSVGSTAADTIDHRHWRQTGAKGTRGKGGVRYFDWYGTPQSAVDPKNPYNFTAPAEGTITTQALQSYYNPELNQYYTTPSGGYTPPDSKWQTVDSNFVDPYGGKPPSAQDTTTAHKEGGTVNAKHFDGGDYVYSDTTEDIQPWQNVNFTPDAVAFNYSDTTEDVQPWQNINYMGNTAADNLAYEGDFGPSGTANNAMMAFGGSNPTEKILNALQKAGVNIGKTMLSSIEKNPMAWLSAIGGAIAGYKGRAKPITPVGLQSLGRSQDQIYARLRGGTYTRKAEGGEIDGYGSGGGLHYLKSAEDGMADRIPATIDGHQPAKLSGGEFVIPADVVSHLGNGNSEAGANHLYAMMDKVRHARTGTKEQGKQIDPDKYTA